MSNFAFLQAEWPAVHEAAAKAEAAVYPDPRTACFYARRAPRAGAGVNLIVDHLTEHGVMGASLLYESPFTDITPHGPDGLFTFEQVDELVEVLGRVQATALVA